MTDLAPSARAPLLVLGFLGLAFGAAGGLARLGLPISATPSAIAWHGALMASAFFGTLISLERAVAKGRLWAYAAPAANGAGGVALLFGAWPAAVALLVAGALVFTMVSTSIWFRHRALHTGVLALGSLALLVANVALGAAAPIEVVAQAWIAFFVLTIGGERLELSRLVRVPRAASGIFVVIAVAVLATALCALASTESALRVGGVLLVACAAWLARYDIATRTWRAKGLTRYIAVCLLTGYAWLALGGITLALSGSAVGGRLAWDAALHAILLGFVFSMVFGHAPVILPAVLRIAFPYRPVLYLPLALLHATLALRVLGDFGEFPPLRSAGALGNVASIALFVLTAIALVAFRGAGRRIAHGRPA